MEIKQGLRPLFLKISKKAKITKSSRMVLEFFDFLVIFTILYDASGNLGGTGASVN